MICQAVKFQKNLDKIIVVFYEKEKTMRKAKIITINGTDFIIATYLTFTDPALQRLKNVMANHPDRDGILITLTQRGCAGLSYKLEYATQNVNIFSGYEVFQIEGINVFINPKISLYLIGTEISYEETDAKSGFVFQNPNESGKCGCGESFVPK